ncbi:hypothetical protein E2C01_101376 [Portunus trituberculatus]|uniref:Uncharacterized protein n=1 Tax=Portunus trituberculatus TaxID=210409 RepID=A0A5B7KFN2_PORTR|nr:hypothetical protein [Portunus trituberculatus]
MGPRDSYFRTGAVLHEMVTWRVHETVTWRGGGEVTNEVASGGVPETHKGIKIVKTVDIYLLAFL